MSAILFSIVLPTYNRPARLAAFLESVTRLDYPMAAARAFLLYYFIDINVYIVYR